MKKILLMLGAFIVGFTPITGTTQNIDELFYDVDTSGVPTTDVGEFIHDEVIDEPQGFVQRLIELFGLEGFASGTDPVTGETFGATNFIRYLINVAISLAGFIALIVLISGFGMMLFTTEEEGIAKAKKYIFGAAVAIFVLGISWFIVSGIFYVYNQVAL